ncbi:hypothetical protein HAX54_053070 [Datura stramonium]|uniref:Uncharacterized protein n=1 Tax=Datura stramonium TaxID=4076 RepID=A0ABS8WRU8_DATST|nr:hypothetical protein [Datura stramonium]
MARTSGACPCRRVRGTLEARYAGLVRGRWRHALDGRVRGRWRHAHDGRVTRTLKHAHAGRWRGRGACPCRPSARTSGGMPMPARWRGRRGACPCRPVRGVGGMPMLRPMARTSRACPCRPSARDVGGTHMPASARGRWRHALAGRVRRTRARPVQDELPSFGQASFGQIGGNEDPMPAAFTPNPRVRAATHGPRHRTTKRGGRGTQERLWFGPHTTCEGRKATDLYMIMLGH